MAQKAHVIVLAVALALPCTALAGDDRGHERHTPIVLNGQLHTYDFTGGVGYSSGSYMYVQGYTYGNGTSGSSSFTATQGFVAGARASAFATANSGHR